MLNKFLVAMAVLTAVKTGSVSAETSSVNRVDYTGAKQDRTLVSGDVKFRVVSRDLVRGFSLLNMIREPDNSLVLGFPKNLVGESNVFGGVIIAESDTQDESLGGLKLSDLSPLNVRTVLSSDGKNLELEGCYDYCSETSPLSTLFSIPVVESDDQFLYLDLKSFGENLDIMKEVTGNEISAMETKVTHFDFSLSTLVFDVETSYVVPFQMDAPPKEFTLTTRWYLKLTSAFSPNFVPRAPTKEVGFFTTARNAKELITRFPLDKQKDYVVKYYIKNVPAEYQKAFADGFEDWNANLLSVVGKKFFSYEFLSENDPRYQQIKIGDIRYNVLEWDLVNIASYGGLGPSYANQATGETFSANVYVQGPRIVELYKKWFKISSEIKELTLKGKNREAEKLMVSYVKEMQKELTPAPIINVSLAGLKFVNHSADPRLSDPKLDGADFIQPPEGYSYETYMYGYFRDMISHELGHNLGLRHNFKGNLGANDTKLEGSVSRSIMEYLDREYRHLDRVGAYDIMAVSYGYKNVRPRHSDWFCTDEDVPNNFNVMASAECSSSDATNDPYGMIMGRLDKILNYIILPGSEMAPVWTTDVLASQISPVVLGLANYYATSFLTAGEWTNFYNEKRNFKTDETPKYIIKSISEKVCDPQLQKEIDHKIPEAKDLTVKNYNSFLKMVRDLTASYTMPEQGFTVDNFPCLKDL